MQSSATIAGSPPVQESWSDTGLLNQIDVAIYAVDESGACLRLNPAGERLLGYREADVLGRNMHSLIHSKRPDGSAYPQNECTLMQARAGAAAAHGLREVFWTEAGEPLPVECSVSRVEINGGSGAVITIRDLREKVAAERSYQDLVRETAETLRQRDAAARVERELAEAERHHQQEMTARMERAATDQLREQQELLATVAEVAPVGIAVLDGELHFRWFNRCFQSLVQAPRTGNSGRALLDLVHAVDDHAFQHQLRSVLQTGEPFRSGDSAFRLAGDREMLWRWSLSRLASGELLMLASDVTEQKRAEEALVSTDKMASVGRLAASISHEINNPLEAVTNLLYLVHQDASLSNEACEYIKMAETELARVSHIAAQTLRFHRHAPEAVRVSPQQLVEPVVALYQGKLKNSRVRIELDYDNAQPVVAFEGDLRQILNNLIGNAIEAMPQGGAVRIRTRSHHCARTGRFGMRITVADSGHGMSADTAAHVFEPFYTTKGASGSGLGLWISHTLAERHGGKLQVRSSKAGNVAGRPAGTIFSLFVPSHTQTVQ